MNNYYFTYGSWEGYPFDGGWTRVVASDQLQALAIFRAVHPDTPNGNFCCAFHYDEKEFARTGMAETGNRGNFEHECIELKITRK